MTLASFTKIETPDQLREAQAAIAAISARERAGVTPAKRIAISAEMQRLHAMIVEYNQKRTTDRPGFDRMSQNNLRCR